MPGFPLAAHTIGFIWEQDAAACVRMLSAAGFSRIEFFAADGHLDIRKPIDTFVTPAMAALRQANASALAVDISSHDFNLASLDPLVAQCTVDTYERLMEVAEALGAQAITVHGGRRIAFNPPPDDRQWHALCTTFDRLSERAKARGMRVLVENIAAAVLNNAATMGRFLADGRWSNAGLVYDVANGVAAGDDPVKALPGIIEHVDVIHLSDCTPQKPAHARIGTGGIDFAAIREVLEERAYGGHVVIEIVSPNALDDLIQSRAALKERGWSFS